MFSTAQKFKVIVIFYVYSKLFAYSKLHALVLFRCYAFNKDASIFLIILSTGSWSEMLAMRLKLVVVGWTFDQHVKCGKLSKE